MKKILLFLQLIIASTVLYAQSLQVVNLKCENKTNPAGIEETSPMLSWELRSSQRNVLQTAYRILVADDATKLKQHVGNIWDSKRVNSAASIQVALNAKKLQSAKHYYWKVMVWEIQDD